MRPGCRSIDRHGTALRGIGSCGICGSGVPRDRSAGRPLRRARAVRRSGRPHVAARRRGGAPCGFSSRLTMPPSRLTMPRRTMPSCLPQLLFSPPVGL
eukprot:4974163-Prymnesium_polylepis.1